MREVDRRLRLTARLAACFDDRRDPTCIEHSIGELVAQRVHALALDYEDLNDHDQLRHDPLLAVAAGKANPSDLNRGGSAIAARRWPRRRPSRRRRGERHDASLSCATARESWSCERRVVAKAEQLEGKTNPRFVVTSLTPEQWPAQRLYKDRYCARGEMENRIKEQLSLFADRMSAHELRANQLRLYLASMAYALTLGLRRLALAVTPWGSWQTETLRRRLLKTEDRGAGAGDSAAGAAVAVGGLAVAAAV